MTNAAWERMIIRMTRKQTLECPLYFEVRLQVDLGGPQVGWTMDLVPRMRVPIPLDSDQQLLRIAHNQELLVDSSGMERTFPLQGEEEPLNQAEEVG